MLGVPSFPAESSPQRQNRNKVALKPGKSLMHWIRYANSGQIKTGSIRPITSKELAQHCTNKDCWIAVRGKVFDVSSYMEYHPGGEDELMRGAGTNATALFDQVHKWVNFESMLQKCYLGPLKPDEVINNKVFRKPADQFLVPSELIPSAQAAKPRFDWYQTADNVFLTIYTKTFEITTRDVILDCSQPTALDIKVLLGENFFSVHLDMEQKVTSCQVKSAVERKVEFVLTKHDSGITWKSLGVGRSLHNTMCSADDREVTFRDCIVESVSAVTHNTMLLTIQLPNNVFYECPIGYHVIVSKLVEGMEIRRSYTPVTSYLQSTGSVPGKIYLMVKRYNDGALTPIITSLSSGDVVSMSDCLGTFDSRKVKEATRVFLIAAGTGITPMVRLINHFVLHTQVSCRSKLLFANRKAEDIIWKDQFDEMAVSYSDRFHVSYILSEPDSTWEGGCRGRVTRSTLDEFMTTNPFSDASVHAGPLIRNTSESKLVAICGPAAFTESVHSNLLSIGVPQVSIHCFLG